MSHKYVTKVGSASAPTGIQHVTPIWAGTEARPTLNNTTLGSMRAIASQPRRSGVVCQNLVNFERASVSIFFAPRHALNEPGDIFFYFGVSACHNWVMAGKDKINR